MERRGGPAGAGRRGRRPGPLGARLGTPRAGPGLSAGTQLCAAEVPPARLAGVPGMNVHSGSSVPAGVYARSASGPAGGRALAGLADRDSISPASPEAPRPKSLPFSPPPPDPLTYLNLESSALPGVAPQRKCSPKVLACVKAGSLCWP